MSIRVFRRIGCGLDRRSPWKTAACGHGSAPLRSSRLACPAAQRCRVRAAPACAPSRASSPHAPGGATRTRGSGSRPGDPKPPAPVSAPASSVQRRRRATTLITSAPRTVAAQAPRRPLTRSVPAFDRPRRTCHTGHSTSILSDRSRALELIESTARNPLTLIQCLRIVQLRHRPGTARHGGPACPALVLPPVQRCDAAERQPCAAREGRTPERRDPRLHHAVAPRRRRLRSSSGTTIITFIAFQAMPFRKAAA